MVEDAPEAGTGPTERDRRVHQAFAGVAFLALTGSLFASGAARFAFDALLYAVAIPLLVAYYLRQGRDADGPVSPLVLAGTLAAASLSWATSRFVVGSDTLVGTVPPAFLVLAFALMTWNTVAVADEFRFAN